MGGRWKILHNFLRQSAYTDVYAGCGVAIGGKSAVVVAADGESIGTLAPLCYLRNDSPSPFFGTVAVSLVSLASGKSTQLTAIRAEIGVCACVRARACVCVRLLRAHCLTTSQAVFLRWWWWYRFSFLSGRKSPAWEHS